MSGLDVFLDYLQRNSFVGNLVLVWLSLYFLLALSVFISKITALALMKNKEDAALEDILRGGNINSDSALKPYLKDCLNDRSLNIGLNLLEKNSTSGLSILGIISSTSPFVGLFGTVVSILQSFSNLGSTPTISVIAPAISEALVATAAGIFVAIPAYSFHLILKRKAYELINTVQTQIDVLLGYKDNS